MLEGVIEGVEDVDREGPDSIGRNIFILVGSELEFQEKVGHTQPVIPGVVGPHSCESFSNQEKVFLYRALAGGFLIGDKESLADIIGKYMEKVNGVVDPSEFGGDAHSSTQSVPLLPCGGVVLDS